MRKSLYYLIKSRRLFPQICANISKLLYGLNWYETDNLVRRKIYKRLKGKYYRKIPTINNMFDENQTCIEVPKKVWIIWFQGLENAPDIVKACFHSIKKYYSAWEINVITSENLFSFVSLPKHIVDKWKSGVISNTHFSDIVRLELLNKYGGLYMDATMYASMEMPQFIKNKDFFVFYSDLSTISFGSYYIYSKPGNLLFKEVLNLLTSYWKRKYVLDDYFLMQMFFSMVVEKNPEFFYDRRYLIDYDPHYLSRQCLSQKCDIDRVDYYLKFCFIHKLTYKELPDDISGTTLQYLLKKERILKYETND